MRILHCIPTLGAGGAERQLAYLAAGQVRAGHDVHVATTADGVLAGRVTAGGATLHRLRAGSNRDPRLLWQLYRLIGALAPDVVHTRLTQMDVIGGAAAVARRVPWVLSERSSALAYGANASSALRRMLARRASAIEANSAIGAAYWSGQGLGVPVRVVPAAVPIEEIAAAPAADRASLGIAAGVPVVLFAGRFGEEKNVLLLLDALARLFALRDGVAVLCGTGPLEEAAKARAAELGIAERVRFRGVVGDVLNWMKSATVFVAPSIFEGRPNSVMEAAAARCPLVVSEIPAHRELLDETSALFAPSGDAAAIADALQRVIDDPASAAARAARAYEAVGSFTITAMTERIDALYRDVVAKRHSHGTAETAV